MKKKNFKSLSLKKGKISSFNVIEINGGISGAACNSKAACDHESAVFSCRYTDLRTCVDSFLHCAA